MLYRFIQASIDLLNTSIFNILFLILFLIIVAQQLQTKCLLQFLIIVNKTRDKWNIVIIVFNIKCLIIFVRRNYYYYKNS